MAWKKSSRSGEANCVEIGGCACNNVLIRDSKDPDGLILSFDADSFRSFLEGVKVGEFDR